jgi:excisionase family DNA binding protein
MAGKNSTIGTEEGVVIPKWARAVDPVMTIAQAAELTGLSAWTLKRLGKQGELAVLKLSARRLGIRASEIERFLNNRESTGGAAA